MASRTMRAAAGIETRRRLVEQEDDRISDQGPSQRQALALALGEHAGAVVGSIGEAELLEQRLDPHRRVRHAVEPRVGEQVDAHGEPLPQPRRLGQHADAGAQRLQRLAVEAHAGDDAGAGRGGDEAGQDPEGGGLAGAVGAEQRHDLTSRRPGG